MGEKTGGSVARLSTSKMSGLTLSDVAPRIVVLKMLLPLALPVLAFQGSPQLRTEIDGLHSKHLAL